MFLQTILKRSKEELTRQIQEAEEEEAVAGDFYLLVNEDMKSIGLNLYKEGTAGMFKVSFKNIVKNS